MNKQQVIAKVKREIEKEFDGESSGHDFHHIFRVWKMAKEISKKEISKKDLPASATPKALQAGGGDLFVIELGALLHDIADWKFNKDEKAGGKKARKLLKRLKVDEEIISQVCHIVDNISFKGAGVKNGIATLEGKIVQDADRLDAMGAIGIARTFSYGGSAGREIYNPTQKPILNRDAKNYKKKYFSSSINHFYEKLLLLKDRLNTKTAKKIAIVRHKFLEAYLKQFFNEWEVKVTK